jgi:RNA polymerase sigma factor (sigma-70 family)
MSEHDWLAEQFEQHRSRLRSVAYQMLGSLSDVDDALQETWVRFSRADAGRIESMGAYLTTSVANTCLNMLRSRSRRDEQPVGVHLPDPIVTRADDTDVEHEVVVVESVGLALLVVLDRLSPGERLAFVLHDVFGMQFDEIAGILGRSPAAARQLASRARRRVQSTAPPPDTDRREQRRVVDAFLAAAHDGGFDELIEVLDPDVVLRCDGGTARPHLTGSARGAAEVARLAITFGRPSLTVRPVLVNGAAGVVVLAHGQPYSVMAFTVGRGRVAAIDILADPERLARLDPTVLDPADR